MSNQAPESDHAITNVIRPRSRRTVYSIASLMVVLATTLAFGEQSSNTNLSDGMWFQAYPTEHPSPRWGHSMVYNEQADNVLLFGGSGDLQAYNDLWRFDLSSGDWSEVAPSGSPPSARYSQSAALNTLANRMYIFGGTDLFFAVNSELWEFDLTTSTWAQRTPSGTPPSPRRGASMIYDPQGDRMILYGGYDNISPVADTWELTFSPTLAWHALSTSGGPVPARSDHAVAYDPQGGAMFVFGGAGNAGNLNDVWKLSLNTMTWSAVTGSTPPSTRFGHSMALDAQRDRLIVYAGYSDTGDNADVWALDLGTSTWTELLPDGAPPLLRDAHQSIYDGRRNRMLVFGGVSDDHGNYGDTWSLQWTSTSGVPEPLDRGFVLGIPYPNPSSGGTVRLTLSVSRADADVSVLVLDVAGRLVRRLEVPGTEYSGRYALEWDGRDGVGATAANGVYLFRLIADGKARGTVQGILSR